MDRFRKRLGAAAAKAAWDWTFIPPSTGDLAQDASWSVRVPVDLHLGRQVEAGYGEWTAYLPGPHPPAPSPEPAYPVRHAIPHAAPHPMGSRPDQRPVGPR